MKPLIAAGAALVLAFSPLAASAQTASGAALSQNQRILIQAEIAALLAQVQQLEQALAALQSQSAVVVVTASSTAATTTPGTAPVDASTTPSTAVIKPTVSVNVNATSYTHGSPMTVTWTTSTAFGTDPTRLPYLELFPYGANPIIVPSVRVARPAIGATTYTWIVSPTGIFGDTVTAGKYIVQIGLYNPALSTYIIGGTAQPVTINP
jgi:hypothetical protein